MNKVAEFIGNMCIVVLGAMMTSVILGAILLAFSMIGEIITGHSLIKEVIRPIFQ